MPLLSSISTGQNFTIVDEGGYCSVNNITIAATGTDKINNSTGVLMNENYMAISLYKGTNINWFIF